MSASSHPQPNSPLSRARARNAVILNQLATPGLGSLLARRWVAGIGQLVLAVAGFVLICSWFISVIIALYQQINSDAHPHTANWLGWTGAAAFGLAWLWALWTSFSLLREAQEAAEQKVRDGTGGVRP